MLLPHPFVDQNQYQTQQLCFIMVSKYYYSYIIIFINYYCLLVSCGDPTNLTKNSSKISIAYYVHTTPPVEGMQIYFSCSPGLLLSGPNSSTCMENGEWEPTPQEVACEGIILAMQFV